MWGDASWEKNKCSAIKDYLIKNCGDNNNVLWRNSTVIGTRMANWQSYEKQCWDL